LKKRALPQDEQDAIASQILACSLDCRQTLSRKQDEPIVYSTITRRIISRFPKSRVAVRQRENRVVLSGLFSQAERVDNEA
jgi:hypothetical protein